MTPNILLIVSIFVLATAAVISFFYQRYAEKKLLQLFERNTNQSSCSLCLGNDSFCNTLNFQLDHTRYLRQHSSYLFIFLSVMMLLFNLLTSQLNDRIFFGTLQLFNDTIINSVAKSPGHYYSEMFEQMVNNSIDIDTIIINDQWPLLPLIADYKHSLVICSKYNIKSNSIPRKFLSSVVSINNRNNLQLWIEAWTAAHLSVELLVLKILNGYNYAPDIYGVCGRVYFVEDCGRTLQYHLNMLNLNNRLLVAKELLNMALELTDGTAHPNYSFYLTDITADNVAIQLDEISGSLLSLKVIDWSDVIIVVHDHSMDKNDNLLINVSEHVDCGEGCLTYSKEDICKENICDHNVYAVCKEFLSTEGKLLHEITDLHNANNEQERELKSLLKNCLWPSDIEQHSKKNRLDIAKLIISKIEDILEQSV